MMCLKAGVSVHGLIRFVCRKFPFPDSGLDVDVFLEQLFLVIPGCLVVHYSQITKYDFLLIHDQPANLMTLHQPLPLQAMQDELKENNSSSQDNNDDLYERFTFRTDKGQEPLRIDKFLMNRIEGATRNKLQQSINAGMVLVNGKDVRPNYKV